MPIIPGIFPAMTSAQGGSLNWPDTCITYYGEGETEIPYPASGFCAMIDPEAQPQNVKFGGFQPMTKESPIIMVVGDQLGMLGGVDSHTNGGEAEASLASFFIKGGGSPLVYLGCTSNANEDNSSIGAFTFPSQFQVLLLG